MHKVSDPLTDTPILQPRQSPSWTGVPGHPRSSNLPQHNPYEHGRTVSGPLAVAPELWRKHATSHFPTHEQGSTPGGHFHSRDPTAEGGQGAIISGIRVVLSPTILFPANLCLMLC